MIQVVINKKLSTETNVNLIGLDGTTKQNLSTNRIKRKKNKHLK